jgi:hypothetical protein
MKGNVFVTFGMICVFFEGLKENHVNPKRG